MEDDLISRSALMQSLRGNVLVDVTPELEEAIEGHPGVGGIGMAGIQAHCLRGLAADIRNGQDEACRKLDGAADSTEALPATLARMGASQAAGGRDRWKRSLMDRFTKVE